MQSIGVSVFRYSSTAGFKPKSVLSAMHRDIIIDIHIHMCDSVHTKFDSSLYYVLF